MTYPSATVGVLLVNWNTARLTADCVASLRAGTRTPDPIIIVDNGSVPDDLARLRELPGVEIMPQPENLGFTGANNLGLAHLLRRPVDYVWILNNDTLVDRDCLARLGDVLDRDPAVGAVTGLIYFAEPKNLIWYAGGYFRSLTLTARHRGVFEKDTGQYGQAEDIAFLCGCCMLVRADVLRRLGGFHPSYFAYCEDDEWSHRAQRAGIRLRYEPTARLWHRVCSSIKQNKSVTSNGFYERLIFRNRLFTLRLHARSWQWPFAGAAVLRYALIRTVQALRRREHAVPGAIRQGLYEGVSARLYPIRPTLPARDSSHEVTR